MEDQIIFANEYFRFIKKDVPNWEKIFEPRFFVETAPELMHKYNLNWTVDGHIYQDGHKIVRQFGLFGCQVSVGSADSFNEVLEYGMILQNATEFAKRVNEYFINEGFTFDI